MAKIPLKLADIGEGITEATLVGWLVKIGEQVVEGQPVCEVQTDKAIVELPAPCKGRIVEQRWQLGEPIPVGETILMIESIDQVQKETRLASPSTRRLAKELGVNLLQVIGTGPRGRVLDEDVKQYARGITEKGESLTSIRKAIADKLLHSVTTRPHATHFHEVDAEGIVTIKKQLGEEEEISYTPILLKIIAETLKKHPKWNAHFDEEGRELQTFPSISLGLATHTELGLLVPVIHHVEQKSILQLAQEVKEVVAQARIGKTKVSHSSGSTFTVSNVGGMGGTWATPTIQPPEVAILAIHPIERKAIVLEDGRIAASWRMNLSLSFDHRIFDGVDAIRFTNTLASYTKDPIKLLNNLR